MLVTSNYGSETTVFIFNNYNHTTLSLKGTLMFRKPASLRCDIPKNIEGKRKERTKLSVYKEMQIFYWTVLATISRSAAKQAVWIFLMETND